MFATNLFLASNYFASAKNHCEKVPTRPFFKLCTTLTGNAVFYGRFNIINVDLKFFIIIETSHLDNFSVPFSQAEVG